MSSSTPKIAEKRAVSWEDSREATNLIANQARVLMILPLDELLELYARADSVGAILDPTGYRNHSRELEPAAAMVRAAKALIAACKAAAAVPLVGRPS